MMQGIAYSFLVVAATLLLSGCSASGDSTDNSDDGNSNPNSPNAPSGSPTLTLQLTDAPGDLAHAWVEITGIALQGEADDDVELNLTLFTGSTGMIDLLTLADATADLVKDEAIPPGTYNRLRLDIGNAVIETQDGQVFAIDGSRHPEGKAINGEITCFSCATTNANVKLPNNKLEVEDGAITLLLDFDVSQSFGREAGRFDRWFMRPAILAADRDFNGTIVGRVILEDGVTLPPCGGQTTTLEQFIVRAFDAADAARSGATAADGTYRIAYVVPGRYGMRFDATIEFATEILTLNAVNSPTQVVVEAGGITTLDYTLNFAACSERP